MPLAIRKMAMLQAEKHLRGGGLIRVGLKETALGIQGLTNLSVHNGGHQGYRDAVADVLRRIADQSAGEGDKWAIRKIREIQLKVRQKLREGLPLDPGTGQSDGEIKDLWDDALHDIIP